MRSRPRRRETAAGVAWYEVIGLASGDASRGGGPGRAAASRLRRGRALHLGRRARAGGDRAGGGAARETLSRLHAAIAVLERDDRYGSLPYLLAMVVLVLRDLGEHEAAFEWLERCEREAERLGLGFVARDCRLQRAFLLARDGQLSQAELELAQAGPRRGTGWRGVHRPEAEAQVAALRGDGREAVEAARRALDRVRPGALCFRVWTAVDMAPVLADNGAPDIARGAVDETLAALDERFPGGRASPSRATAGLARLPRARRGRAGRGVREPRTLLGGGRRGGRPDRPGPLAAAAPCALACAGGGGARADAVLPAMQGALPGGEALVAMVDHPDSAVRRAALLTALAAGHPTVLARLTALAKDTDEQVASAAGAASERLRAHPPPLRFELLGGFRVKRAGWELDEGVGAADGRARGPLSAHRRRGRPRRRSVRGVLVGPSRGRGSPAPGSCSLPRTQGPRPARRRGECDRGQGAHVPPAAARADSVDCAEFEAAAAAALADRGAGAPSLARAAELWTGEPAPEDRYAAWSFAWRERLVETYASVLAP